MLETMVIDRAYIPNDYKVFNPTNLVIDGISARMEEEALKIGSVSIERGNKRYPPMREPITNSKSTTGKAVTAASGRDSPTAVEIIGTTPGQHRTEFISKWEEMIAQASWNMKKIIEPINPRVKTFFKKTYFDTDTKSWRAGSNQMMDIQVVEHYDSDDEDEDEGHRYEIEELIESNLPDPRGGAGGSTEQPIQTETQRGAYHFQEDFRWPSMRGDRENPIIGRIRDPSVVWPLESDGEHKHSVLVNSYVFNTLLTREFRTAQPTHREILDEGPVYLFRTVIPGPHFTICIYYPCEKRVEFFDSGGSFGGEITYPDGDNKPVFSTLERLRSTRTASDARSLSDTLVARYGRAEYRPRCLSEFTEREGENPVENALCSAFQNIFGYPDGVEFVPINQMDLQPSDSDAHCQVWVWLYVYIKFILGLSSKDTLKYLNLLNEHELLTLIEGWREFLLYFDYEEAPLPPASLDERMDVK